MGGEGLSHPKTLGTWRGHGPGMFVCKCAMACGHAKKSGTRTWLGDMRGWLERTLVIHGDVTEKRDPNEPAPRAQ
ncbi:hypothetical protein QJS04_geneDACA020563 [Acorus gramineus]|uniref:Uncharacterized protein n=1 Tax=Acorus gramineus TaxID=55184 RepID=A0AAV9A035_ACOGR|nr:hypothetical protein QJS04_geneDACA020563 [Acorus gramineus]